VTVTDTGLKILPLARRILQESDEIVSLARNEHDPLSGKMKLALIPTIGPYLLPLVMRKLRKQLPDLKLMLYEYQTQPLLEKLRAGEIEVGILALPVAMDGLEAEELYEENFTVAVPSNHPLSKRSTAIRLDDLTGETLLLLEDGHCLRDQALDVCNRIDVKENEDYRATSLETLRQMVAAGLGVTLLPELATRGPFGSGQGLTVKSFAKPVPTRTIGAVWRKSSSRIEAIKAVGDVIRATLNDRS
jgi:LysR family hydrogen peroxide-inducible transcriptional activator